MVLSISELYGKKVISSSGAVLGEVRGVIIDLETARVSYLLFDEIDKLVRSSNLRGDFRKNSVAYDRVTRISEGIVVKSAPVEKK
ncbi:MAG: PRC-barrel domain-containing protein [Candidatus Marsarchaeota archaeon]|jgi:sporulation protein YlmC with PRC-barrel domain|nr:PRC-barrel domain-containing protein [Candidatus Marsarchaeota archaeon]